CIRALDLPDISPSPYRLLAVMKSFVRYEVSRRRLAWRARSRSVNVMCRLLGFVSREATSLPSALGTDFDEFTKLSLGLHADGWGVATAPITAATNTSVPLDSAPSIRLGIDAAHSNPDFLSAASMPSAASLVHLRAA